MADILSLGKSSRLYRSLVKEQKLFSEISAYMSGDLDKGLFLIAGKIMHGVSIETAEKAIRKEIEKLTGNYVADTELEKVKQKFESSVVFSEMNIGNKALSLAYCEMLGDVNLVNKTLDNYRSVTKDEIRHIAENVFTEKNCSALYYQAATN
jgi:predicted Zn-dependent peptidase